MNIALSIKKPLTFKDFLLLATKKKESDEIDDPEDEDEPLEKPKPKESEDMPEWAKKWTKNLESLLKPSEQSNNGTTEIPVPEPPKHEEEEEDQEEPPQEQKKQSFLSWLL